MSIGGNRKIWVMPDSIYLATFIILLIVGALIFLSASFGLLAKTKGDFSSVLVSQFILGFGGGFIAFLFLYTFPVEKLRKFSIWIYLAAILMTLAVFIPSFGITAGGATRWLNIGNFSFQPAEFLKIATILILAAWYAGLSATETATFKMGLLPIIITSAISGIILLSQPDTGTYMVILGVTLCIFIIAGGRLKHILSLIGISILLVIFLAMLRPYVLSRILTFYDPMRDPQGQSYQINQSLIAVGAGEITGRGFGGSVQKFRYLPEPIGDSIFAVLAEEFGFLGTTMVVLLFIAFTLRGLSIANKAMNKFDRLVASGLAIMICIQAFLNISAMIGLMPLTGIPLPFISQGGTALVFSISSAAIILNISKRKQKAT